jgi:GTP cyclohydrolase II
MRIIAFIEDYKVIRKILDYLGIYEFKRIRNNLDKITNSVNRGILTVIGDNLKSIKEDLKKYGASWPG